MFATAIVCPYCNKHCSSEAGLRRHITHKQECKKKELEGLQGEECGHKTVFDYMEMDHGPPTSSQKSKRCENSIQNLGPILAKKLQITQDFDDNSTNSSDSLEQPNGHLTDSSDNEAQVIAVNTTGPLKTILNDFSEYTENYWSIYHDFIHNEITCIDLLRRLRATKAALSTYESIMEWQFKA